jgi:hypothetical protein
MNLLTKLGEAVAERSIHERHNRKQYAHYMQCLRQADDNMTIRDFMHVNQLPVPHITEIDLINEAGRILRIK